MSAHHPAHRGRQLREPAAGAAHGRGRGRLCGAQAPSRRHRRGFGAERAWLRAGPRCGRRRGALRVPGDRYLLSTQPERDGRCRAGAGAAAGAARADGLRVVITLGAAFGCPFEGCVAPARMLDLAAQVQRAAPDEIVLADTMGVGVPRQVRELVAGVRALAAVAGCHFHNTRNTGFTNALAAVEAGATVLDASLGGLGGCPFAPRATGNIATEDLVYLLRGMGYELSAEHRPAGAHRVRCVAVRSARQGSPRPSLQSWRLRAGGIVKGGATMAYRLGVGTSGESGVLSPP